MSDRTHLIEPTERYLASLVAESSGIARSGFDAATSFGDLGVDSFRVLKIIKALEADFGTLPKTLLFENFNIESLARYFVDRHADTLIAKFSPATPTAARPAPVDAAPAIAVAAPASAPAPDPSPTAGRAAQAGGSPAGRAAVEPAPSPEPPAESVRMLERDLEAFPALQSALQAIYEQYKNEGCVSRGTRNIAPNLFIDRLRRGYFNYSRSGRLILVYAYTGPQALFGEIAEQMQQYCVEKGFQLNFFIDEVLESIGGTAYSSTPFGALQRILDLKHFTLEGGAMRRLRYLVGKFEKSGACRTVEYACGSDPATDRAIAGIIDRWCEARTMVNPLIHIVRQEILDGSLHPQHRIFLTYLDDALQNVILISGMSGALNGYLMDLEFYPPEMPLGGLEYAIVQIIAALVAEGRDMLSLGGTYGCRLETSPHADPEVDRILDDLHSQKIFNDEGNLQFKNKFRPENRTIYLCRPKDAGPGDNVLDIIMMIADPAKAQTPDTENHNPPVPRAVDVPAARPAVGAEAGLDAAPDVPRAGTLAEAGFNPLNLPSAQVDFDLKTDSWAQLDSAFVGKRMAHLRSRLQQPVNLHEQLRAIFPFEHFVLTDAGRSADHLLCKAFGRTGRVLQNLLFPTCLYHQIDKGFTPRELPHPALFDLRSHDPAKAGLCLDALRRELAAHGDDIAYVCIEVSDNAAGGAPIAIEHLREVKALIAPRSIPLVVDATRVLENAWFLTRDAARGAGEGMWQAARALLGFADAIIGSLAKDFCVDKGGLVATRDPSLLRRLQQVLDQDGGGLDVIEKKLVGLALQDRRHIELQIDRRVRAVETIWKALDAAGVPVVAPVGGHCVLIDVAAIPAFAGSALPVAECLAFLYLNTGVRAAAHSVGMQKGTALNRLIRLAIPVGLAASAADEIARRLVAAFAGMRNVPRLSGADAPGDVHAKYALLGYLNPVSSPLRDADVAPSAAPVTDAPAVRIDTPRTARATPAGASAGAPAATDERFDIAIVGLAGRYPRARDPEALWRNLRDGIDCIEELPESRYARRFRTDFSRRYRGGFVDDIDRFDSLFFNVSPREAEMLDPQERLFLEVAWEALEDAGYYPESLAPDHAPRNVGVFVGAVWTMYQMLGVERKVLGDELHPNSFLWSIANRVSYWMNLTGPSLTVDTACSSSMTALQLACEAIRGGGCDSAIVGGVNLDLHQHKFDINNAGGALSKDGVCRTFGAGANGYVAGEGVIAILIKPLAKAIEDRDQVYGVIKSALVNHGGRTSSYTVPNPKAQGALIAAALRKAGVEPDSIGYIEAHGTGTELGDPVEISGLDHAFASARAGVGSVPIGSIKTNIGHLEAAAGLAGVSKVLLQLKHRQLAPSLHAEALNPHIDFSSSPFRVQRTLEPWEPKRLDGRALPLRAGISSFGAGGANAHVVIESFEAAGRDVESGEAGPRVFPLSARNEDQLRAMAAALCRRLETAEPPPRAGDVAFTLQDGRKSFDHRLAIVADGVPDLVAKLRRYAAGASDPDILAGNARNADGIARLLSHEERSKFLELLSQRQAPHKIAQLWAEGLLADCRGMTADGRRISLPTYPFADKRHWLPDPARRRAPVAGAIAGLHPLIDSNASTFQRQLFRKSFREDEFFLHDHVVSDVPTLPGTAYVDLARKAGEVAAGARVDRVRNITWVSPLTASAASPTPAMVELRPAADGVLFEVFADIDADAAAGARTTYCQGKLLYAADPVPSAPDEYVDLEAIRARCAQVADAGTVYPLFERVGLRYGPSFRLLETVWANDDEVLGLLRLPEVRDGDFEDFVFHPCILDAAMQAGVAAQLCRDTGEMRVPYSIGEIERLHPLTRTCYSHLTRSPGDRSATGGLAKQHLDILDETGRVLMRIRESVGVPLNAVHGKAVASSGADPGAELAQRDAAAVAAPSAPSPASTPAVDADGFAELFYGQRWVTTPAPETPAAVGQVLLFETDPRRGDALAAAGRVWRVRPGAAFAALGDDAYTIDPRNRDDYVRLLQTVREAGWNSGKLCFAWPLDAWSLDERPGAVEAILDLGVHALLFLCQALMTGKSKQGVQLLCAHGADGEEADPLDVALAGFARTVRLENPRIECKVLHLDRAAAAPDRFAACVRAELDERTRQAVAVRWVDGVRAERTLYRLDDDELPAAGSVGAALRHRGVYVITGGVGGLGLIFAEHLARTCRARLVLTGRSALSDASRARVAALEAAGAEVLHVAADVACREDVARLLAEARARFGRIDGVLHSAGVLRDAFLWKKTRDDMRAVLAPKVDGTLLLDELTAEDDLDFFALFSSLAAFGNAGQCDYAYANHFMDAHAALRERRRARGERRGHSLSLNWSLWAEGGMKLDEQTELFFRTKLGIKPLGTDFGLRAFERGLMSAQAQLAVLEGVADKIEAAWGIARPEASTAVAAGPAAAPPAVVSRAASDEAAGDLRSTVVASLSGIVMEMLKIEEDDLSLDSILLDLGFDSIGLAGFANALNARYGLDINPTMFFEYPSINAIAGVLVDEHAAAMRQAHGAPSPAGRTIAAATPATSATSAVATPAATIPFAVDKGWQPAATPAAAAWSDGARNRFREVPIAIVGIAGTMPQSDTLDEFWGHLQAGRDLVTEIPRDRWTWEDYDGNPAEQANTSYSRWGGFMKHVDRFDPLFFGITPREAEMMDPQQRIFIETVWAAIEDSGHRVSDLSGTRTGVFVGVSAKDYIDVLSEQHSTLDGFSASGNSHSILANRISFLLNLRGPSAPLDTACSSSLVALHRAIESIHTGSSDMAIVGGVQVMLTPIGHVSLSTAGMLSPDGKCKAFDKSANGYVRGEGSGAIFIKPLAKALEDGNPVYAVIKATAENHGGRVTMLTAPNPKAQAELLTEAYTRAGVDPASVGYIECHGTGTSLGDPIEIQALKKAFSDLYRQQGHAAPKAPHCGLSSVKTNIGHLEPAAAMASLLKVLLAIRHREIPALLHFETLNPYIDLEGSPFYIVDRTTPWQPALGADGSAQPLVAGVSSFGWGGANAHAVLEEYRLPARGEVASGPQPIVLSAKHPERLRAYAASMARHLRAHAVPLSDLAYTLQVGRDAMEERLGFVAESTAQAAQLFEAFAAGERPEGLFAGRVRRHKAAADEAAPGPRAEDPVALVRAWVEGAEIDWRTTALAPAAGARRVSLPTYPFAPDRHWVEAGEAHAVAGSGHGAAALHPLVHANVSTMKLQRYRSRFGGAQRFPADAAGRPSALAFAGMASAAIGLALVGEAQAVGIELADVAWCDLPATMADRTVLIDLFERGEGGVDFEIHDLSEHDLGAPALDQNRAVEKRDHAPTREARILRCRGRGRMLRRADRPSAGPAPFDAVTHGAGGPEPAASPRPALDALARQWRARGPVLHAPGRFRFATDAIPGDALPADGGKAGRPDDASRTWTVPPGLIESVVHAATLLAAGESGAADARPAFLSSLQVFAPCRGSLLVDVRLAVATGEAAPAVDFDLFDGEGRVCVRARGMRFGDGGPARASEAAFLALLETLERGRPGDTGPSHRERAETQAARLLERTP